MSQTNSLKITELLKTSVVSKFQSEQKKKENPVVTPFSVHEENTHFVSSICSGSL